MNREKEITLDDIVKIMVTNDALNYDYARKQVNSLKRKYRFLSLTMIIYILYKEGVFKGIKHIIKDDILNK